MLARAEPHSHALRGKRDRGFESTSLRQRVSGLRASPGKCVNCACVAGMRAAHRHRRTHQRRAMGFNSGFSLWASNSVPMPILGEHHVGTKTTNIVSRVDGAANFESEKGSGIPGYSRFNAVLCARHESGSSMRRVRASAVRIVGCRPSTMDSTISGARKARRTKRPT